MNCVLFISVKKTFHLKADSSTHLLGRYSVVGTLARPVKDSKKSVTVEFMMTLVQILDFDETKQLIISKCVEELCKFLLLF